MSLPNSETGKAEARERALSFICPNPRPSVDDLVKLLEAEAALARKEERQACAKAMCRDCANVGKSGWLPKAEIIKGTWAHRFDSEHYRLCTAAAIHERDREETES